MLNNAEAALDQGFERERISSRSVFQDDIWILDGAPAGQGVKVIYWESFAFADGSNITDQRYADLLLSCKTFLVLCAKGRVSRGLRPPRSSMVYNLAFNLRQLVTWMVSHDIGLFSDLTEGHVIAYRNHVRRRKTRKKARGGKFVSTDTLLSEHSRFTALLVVAHIVRLQSEIPFGCKLSNTRVHDLLWAGQKYGTRKRTLRIPDGNFVPLMNKALWWLDEVAPKVLARAEVFAHFRRTHKSAWNWQYDELYEESYTEALVEIAGAQFDVNTMRAPEVTTWIIYTMVACFIVIAGLTGMRASEVLSLRKDCLKTIARGGRKILALAGTLYKTSDETEGEPAQWVAGWDEEFNPIRRAVSALLQLNAIRDVADERLFFRASNRRKAEGYSRASIQDNINRFARLIGVADWTFTPHQFRKTFARFVALAAPNAAIALMRHFKHVSVQMTERYFPTDPALMDDVMDATLELVAEKIDSVLGSEKLAGMKGAEILARNSRFRGEQRAAERKRMTEMTMLDPSARVLLHVYGLCIYDESTAKCEGRLVNVGLNMCGQCPNLVIEQQHLPFWQAQEQALAATLEELRTRGGTSLEIERRHERACEHIRRLGNGRPESSA